MTTEFEAAADIARPLRNPTQSRARATFAKILDAAVHILSTEGLSSFNTNRIAGEAGVNVATLYSYFANKESLLAYLATRFEDKRAASIEHRAEQLGTHSNWEQWFIDSIDAMVDFRLREPGGLAVRQALMAMPHLNEIDRESTRRATEAKIPGLLQIAPHLSESTARTISHIYTLSVTAVLDEAFQKSPHDEQMVEQLKIMTLAFLRNHLTPA
ncbi:TetR/AcrR family transcriptional regulator [Brevibacterium album]|uniref:TetR/AcrR family transcriptional regulator n=1 Tax=Brevibacterium album TaxID=417948 RepID=UPI000425EC0A|nr:TetR/AcrR family transcriptional regulator [Brevibacterium album]